jgi:phage tail tape-measure protein
MFSVSSGRSTPGCEGCEQGWRLFNGWHYGDNIMGNIPATKCTADRVPGATVQRLRDFIENGCDARPEDKHHALQDLEAIQSENAESDAMQDVWSSVRLKAEGADWDRDHETLAEWVWRKL